MAVYATVADVQARAGRLAGVFAANAAASRHPDTADVTAFLTTVSSEIDVEVRRAGFDPASLTTDETEALRDVAAYGALARALAGVDTSNDGAVAALVTRAESVWSPVPSAMRSAVLAPLMSVLGALAEVGVPSGPASAAGSFLDDSPAYGSRSRYLSEHTPTSLDRNTTLPQFQRGQPL